MSPRPGWGEVGPGRVTSAGGGKRTVKSLSEQRWMRATESASARIWASSISQMSGIQEHTNSMSLTEVKSKCTGWEIPVVSPGWLQLLLGVLNCFLFGVGVIIAGALNNSLVDVVIGILQLCIPFVGWIWAVLWGVLMVLKAVK
ncbi:hypothetical protein BASA81_006714 [Batrachochytrium salamandrivorans]|nr:hypothetical protein BASA81_006714 [Batrachochytrium salamandrivorans]